jgi:hypothetical protein
MLRLVTLGIVVNHGAFGYLGYYRKPREALGEMLAHMGLHGVKTVDRRVFCTDLRKAVYLRTDRGRVVISPRDTEVAIAWIQKRFLAMT